MATQPDDTLIPFGTDSDRPNLDLPLHGLGVYPVEKSAVEKCPDEILLAFAAYLEKADLINLARVSKSMCNIAQDLLYRAISLSGQQDRNYGTEPQSSISRLLWTLSRSPRLAQKVRCLGMYPVQGSLVRHDFETFPGIPGSAVPAMVHGGMVSCRILEPTLVGALLSMLPGLRELGFGVLPISDGSSSRGQRILDNLGICPKKMDMIPGLANLERLHFFSGTIDGPFLELPKLQHISLHRQIDVEHVYSNASASKVHSLSLTYPNSILVPTQPGIREGHVSLLSSLPQLRSLTISLQEAHNCYIHQGTWSKLINELECVYNTLEELTLMAYGDPKWLDQLGAVHTLRNFSKLRKLTIAESTLLGSNYPGGPHHPKNNVAHLLPARLQTLQILYPWLIVASWLEILFMKHAAIPDLAHVDLICSTLSGASKGTILDWTDDIVGKLRSVGITVTVSNDSK